MSTKKGYESAITDLCEVAAIFDAHGMTDSAQETRVAVQEITAHVAALKADLREAFEAGQNGWSIPNWPWCYGTFDEWWGCKLKGKFGEAA